MEPKLDIAYSSGAGNGWLGLGWNLSIPSITIDTRWGAPRYRLERESETYSARRSAAHTHGQPGGRAAARQDREFHTRIEGGFQKIIRHGTRPEDYWWEVTDKDGTRYFYGGIGASEAGATLDNGVAHDCVDKTLDPPTRDQRGDSIFKWALREVRDLNGNTIRFDYERIFDSGTGSGDAVDRNGNVICANVPGVNLYPTRITYTGFRSPSGEIPGAYAVDFVRERRRPDVSIDARGGFKMVTADRLQRIDVKFRDQRIRSYELTYTQGAFEKSLLASIRQLDGDGDPIADPHEFSYHKADRLFADQAAPTQVGEDDNVRAGVLFGDDDEASALSGAGTNSTGGGGFIGIGVSGCSIGGKLGGSSATTKGLLALLDINGDSLPDKVFKKDDRLYLRLHRRSPAGDSSWTDKREIDLPEISSETASSFSAGLQASCGVSASANQSESAMVGPVYFSDVNADGLPDLVDADNHRILFNHAVDAQGRRCDQVRSPEPCRPVFEESDANTPFPLGSRGILRINDLITLSQYQALFDQYADLAPPVDSIRRWVAPFDGHIRVLGDLSLVEDTTPARQNYPADGVRVAVQVNGNELWSETIDPTDYTSKTPTVPDLAVQKGDRVYFRVGSVRDGRFDQVAWDPSISYLSLPSSRDANGLNPAAYQASDDFTLGGRPGIAMTLPFTGTVQLSGVLRKLGVTSDDVTLEAHKTAFRFPGQPKVSTRLYEETLAWDEQRDLTLNQTINVTAGDQLELHLRVDSPIDVSAGAIDFRPLVTYVAREGGPVTTPTGDPLIKLVPPYHVDVYPENNLRAPQDSWVSDRDKMVRIAVQAQVFPEGDPTKPRCDRDLSELFICGRVTFTVKSLKPDGRLVRLAKRAFREGDQLGEQIDLSVEKDERLFFDFSSIDPTISRRLSQDVQIADLDNPNDFSRVPVGVHGTAVANVFPLSYRGWSFAGYNGKGDRADHPIDESLLNKEYKPEDYGSLCTSRDPSSIQSFISQNFKTAQCNLTQEDRWVFAPLPGLQRAGDKWTGPDADAWVTAIGMSSSRLGGDPGMIDFQRLFGGSTTVPRLSKTSRPLAHWDSQSRGSARLARRPAATPIPRSTTWT